MATTKSTTTTTTASTSTLARTQGITNAVGTPAQSLQTFDLTDLQQYTPEQAYSTNASKDFHLFYVGRDDVHDILKHVLSRASVSIYLNMFGFDDEELNDILMAKVLDPNITMLITLDKSQSGGPHEKALLTADQQHNLAAFNTHFVIGQSSTHQISHTKGFVADGKVGGEGSTNWSVSGEGTFVVTGKAGGPGYKAQNNTQSIFTDNDTISRFTAELIAEHMSAQKEPSNTKNASIDRTKEPTVTAKTNVKAAAVKKATAPRATATKRTAPKKAAAPKKAEAKKTAPKTAVAKKAASKKAAAKK